MFHLFLLFQSLDPWCVLLSFAKSLRLVFVFVAVPCPLLFPCAAPGVVTFFLNCRHENSCDCLSRRV